MRQRPAAISWYYCDEHTTKNAVLLKDVNFGELKCGKCGADAEYREYK
jgi:transcription elongation factor Elf1